MNVQQTAQPLMLTGLWNVSQDLIGKHVIIPRIEFLSLSLEVTSRGAYSLWQTPWGAAAEGSTQASVVEKSST